MTESPLAFRMTGYGSRRDFLSRAGAGCGKWGLRTCARLHTRWRCGLRGPTNHGSSVLAAGARRRLAFVNSCGGLFWEAAGDKKPLWEAAGDNTRLWEAAGDKKPSLGGSR